MFLCGGVGAILAFIVLRTLRWRALLGPAAGDVPFVRLYIVNCVSVAVASFTPAQAGEVMKIELLKRFGGVARWSGATSFVLERIADLAAILIFAAVGLVAHPTALPRFGDAYGALVPVALVIICLLGAVIARTVLRRLPRVPALSRRSLARLVLSTGGIWCCVVAGWWISARSVQVHLELIDTFGLVGIVTLGTVLSLLPGGLGVAEALITVVLKRMGYSVADAQATALAVRAFGLLWIPIGLVHFVAGIAVASGSRGRTSSATMPTMLEGGAANSASSE